jgi:cell wall-associated NlpC family hydrolase
VATLLTPGVLGDATGILQNIWEEDGDFVVSQLAIPKEPIEIQQAAVARPDESEDDSDGLEEESVSNQEDDDDNGVTVTLSDEPDEEEATTRRATRQTTTRATTSPYDYPDATTTSRAQRRSTTAQPPTTTSDVPILEVEEEQEPSGDEESFDISIGEDDSTESEVTETSSAPEPELTETTTQEPEPTRERARQAPPTTTTIEPTQEPTTETPEQEGGDEDSEESSFRDRAVEIAKSYVGKNLPYRYGGDSFKTGIDCSHFLHRVLSEAGYSGDYQSSASLRATTTRVAKGDIVPGETYALYNGHVGLVVGIEDGVPMIVHHGKDGGAFLDPYTRRGGFIRFGKVKVDG